MDIRVPLFDLNYDKREERAVVETLQSKWISTGPKCQEFEEKFSEALGVNYSITLGNCTSALHLALLILGISHEDEVIVPSLTFVATSNAVLYVGAKPVFCDIKGKDDLTIDPENIRKNISPKTKAIIVMHYGGFSCDMDEIMRIAKDNDLFVIEDACHAPLSEYKGKKLGTIGDIGCFSFFSNKNMSTGEGGMLVTNNQEFDKKARLLRSHGMTKLSYERSKGHNTLYDVIDLGFNYRMDDIHAALGLVQLEKLPDDIKKRNEVRNWYIDKLDSLENIIIPFQSSTELSSNYVFSVVLDCFEESYRDKLRQELSEAGIQTSIHYPPAHKFEIYKKYNKNLPKTEFVADNAISLPMYSSMTEHQVDYVVKTLKSLVQENV